MNSQRPLAQHNLGVIAWLIVSFAVPSLWHLGEYMRMLWLVNILILWAAFSFAVDPDAVRRKNRKVYWYWLVVAPIAFPNPLHWEFLLIKVPLTCLAIWMLWRAPTIHAKIAHPTLADT